MAEWEKIRLGDVCRTNADTYSPKEKWNFVNYLDTGNITNNTIDSIQFIELKNMKLPSRAKRKVKTDSIIYSTVRPNQRHFGIVKSQPENFLVSTGFVVIDVDTNVLNADFLYYLLTQNTLVDALQAIAEQSTSAYPAIKPLDIENLEIEIPDLATQKKISDILSSLDRKIAKNAEINKNLEQQAMAIFNNAIEQSKSVTYVELGSLADVKGGKRLPKGANLMSIPNSHPYIRVRDLNDVVFASLSANYEYVDDETQKTISRYITTTDDVLISIVGTIGLTAIVDKSLNMANLTENCVKVTNLHGISPEYLLLYLRSQHGSEEIKKGTVGAVQAKLPIKNIQALSVPLLPQSDLQSLNDTLKVLFNQLSINVAESKCLTDIRDSLLPKLMSGELDVSNLDL